MKRNISDRRSMKRERYDWWEKSTLGSSDSGNRHGGRGYLVDCF